MGCAGAVLPKPKVGTGRRPTAKVNFEGTGEAPRIAKAELEATQPQQPQEHPHHGRHGLD